MSIDLDRKAQKLTTTLQAKLPLADGESLVLAVPVKQGSVAAGAAAMLVSTRTAMRVERYQRGKVQGEIASLVQRQVGSGTDHLLCLSDRNLIIVRKIAFGVTGANCAIPNSDVATIHTDRGMLKGVALVQFADDSTMPFKVPRNADLDLLRQAADQIYGASPPPPS
jgi:hypothetical protein